VLWNEPSSRYSVFAAHFLDTIQLRPLARRRYRPGQCNNRNNSSDGIARREYLRTKSRLSRVIFWLDRIKRRSWLRHLFRTLESKQMRPSWNNSADREHYVVLWGSSWMFAVMGSAWLLALSECACMCWLKSEFRLRLRIEFNRRLLLLPFSLDPRWCYFFLSIGPLSHTENESHIVERRIDKYPWAMVTAINNNVHNLLSVLNLSSINC